MAQKKTMGPPTAPTTQSSVPLNDGRSLPQPQWTASNDLENEEKPNNYRFD